MEKEIQARELRDGDRYYLHVYQQDTRLGFALCVGYKSELLSSVVWLERG
jgi:hypothetical protein